MSGPRFVVGDLTGAVADLGVMIPLAGALVLVNGLSGGMVLVAAGLFAVASGLWFRIPFPVQPLKALTAVAVAHRLPPETITAAGLMVGVALLLVSLGPVTKWLQRLFTVPVVRALQFGVGLLLVVTAVRLAVDPPAVFASAPPAGTSPMTFELPSWPAPGHFATALVLLVIPQLPLTFGNAVVAVTDVAHRAFGARAERVTPRTVARSAALGNIAAAAVGGMPMCHGSSGLTAHYRLGARTAAMNVALGGALVGVGLLFGATSPTVLAQAPPLLLAVLLAYAGVRHALLVADQRGRALGVAMGAGAVGAATGNLLLTMVIAIAATAWARPPAQTPGGGEPVSSRPGGGDRTAPRRDW